MKQVKFSKYNDGVVSVYREIERLSDFNAKRNSNSLNNLTFIVKLDFEESSKRIEDLEFAEQNGFDLNLKVKTRKFKTIDNKCKAIVDNMIYDINYVDYSKNEMFLYLSGGVAI